MIQWQAYIQPPRQGTSHKRDNLPCQDKAAFKENNEVIVAVLADGVGSLEHSEIAAHAITLAISEYLLNYDYEQLKKDSLKADILEECKRVLFERAKSLNISVSKMDCTLLFVVLFKKGRNHLFGQLGDGAICAVKQNQGYQVIASDDSFKASSNLTKTVLSTDALDSLNLGGILASDLVGFFLTTDGLENELYSKAGKVKKKLEWYFNLISNYDESVCESEIQNRWDELTSDEKYGFTDDMSLIAIVRQNIKIELPEDANWLCVCEHRNRMESSYCEKCGKDFLKIYKDLNFKQNGGSKLSFFTDINAHPHKELRVLKKYSTYPLEFPQPKPPLPYELSVPVAPVPSFALAEERPVPVAQVTQPAPVPVDVTPSGNGHRRNLSIIAYLLLAFVFGIIVQAFFDNSKATTELLSIQKENEILQSENDSLNSELQNIQRANETLQSENGSLTSELLSIQRANETLQSENDSLNSELQNIQRANETIQSVNDSLAKTIAILTRISELLDALR